MTYTEAIQFLYDLRLFGSKLGLENTQHLAARAGDPQRHLRFIHVAGTNGKGSTCAMLESIYRAAGLKVGLYTSPHLICFGERIQVNRQPASETEIIQSVQGIQPLVRAFPEGRTPTFFEVVTVMALQYFQMRQCDLVIWETGLGGRLDATNIVDPLACVITNIDLDHQKWLGESIPAIAAEKAGIIKPNVPVITAEQKPEPYHVIAATAAERHAPLVRVDPRDSVRLPEALSISLPGEHQLLNAATALATVRALSPLLPVEAQAIRIGLSSVHWPGRFQVVPVSAGRTLILDGAHNPAAAEVLRHTYIHHFPGTLPTLILAILNDKDWPSICRILAPIAGRILTVPVNTDRSADAPALASYCAKSNPLAEVRCLPSVRDALAQSAADPIVLITGSLYLVGEASEALKLGPVSSHNEKPLNDYGPAPQN